MPTKRSGKKKKKSTVGVTDTEEVRVRKQLDSEEWDDCRYWNRDWQRGDAVIVIGIHGLEAAKGVITGDAVVRASTASESALQWPVKLEMDGRVISVKSDNLVLQFEMNTALKLQIRRLKKAQKKERVDYVIIPETGNQDFGVIVANCFGQMSFSIAFKRVLKHPLLEIKSMQLLYSMLKQFENAEGLVQKQLAREFGVDCLRIDSITAELERRLGTHCVSDITAEEVKEVLCDDDLSGPIPLSDVAKAYAETHTLPIPTLSDWSEVRKVVSGMGLELKTVGTDVFDFDLELLRKKKPSTILVFTREKLDATFSDPILAGTGMDEAFEYAEAGLMRAGGHSQGLLPFVPGITTRKLLVSWLNEGESETESTETECIMCYEALDGFSMPCSSCATRICSLCTLQLALEQYPADSKDEFTDYECPNCRYMNRTFISHICAWAILRGNLGEFDKSKQKLIRRKAVRAKGIEMFKCKVDAWSCGHCQKKFWDRKAQRVAPKCKACKRVRYCNAKCLRSARKKHKDECLLWSLK